MQFVLPAVGMDFPDAAKTFGTKLIRKSHERGPHTAVDVGDFSTHKTTNKNVI